MIIGNAGRAHCTQRNPGQPVIDRDLLRRAENALLGQTGECTVQLRRHSVGPPTGGVPMSPKVLSTSAPGPKAKARTSIWSVTFVIAAGSGDLVGDRQVKRLVGGDTWSTGLLVTLKAAGLSPIGALLLGAVLAMGRLSDHA